MKLVFRITLLLVLLPIVGVAQKDERWPPLQYLRSDFRATTVVAHVVVNSAGIVNKIGGYDDWRLQCRMVEPFKGKFRAGETIEFFYGAETGAKPEQFLGERIVFLQRNYHEKEKKWVYAALENSTLSYSADRVRKLRIIKREKGRRKSYQTRRHN